MIALAEIALKNKILPPAGSVPVRIETTSFLDDMCTPVSLYLRLRDRFPGAILLESADNAEGKNSRSFIAINPVAGILVEKEVIKISIPAFEINVEISLAEMDVAELLNEFLQLFKLTGKVPKEAVSGLIGYMTYEAVQYFEDIQFRRRNGKNEIPALRYDLYKNVIVFDHLRHQLHIVEQLLPDDEGGVSEIESLIRQMGAPQYRFEKSGMEIANCTDEDFLVNVDLGKLDCRIGDVFQIVLSRRFKQKFTGDEFNVYRSLRAINPSPYLFFADFGDYRIFGSSPEAQLVVRDRQAFVFPIAGTFRRTGDELLDSKLEEQLLNDPKENSEHIMLVDLARNDLSRTTKNVQVEAFREVHRFSHVIHLVSKVSGALRPDTNIFRLLGNTFPAGTLSGAPKIKAMQLIDQYEPTQRSYYGGCIGLIGFDGSMNQAIMIRSFLSKNGELTYQAGAGITISSVPEKELQEINNKLEALRKAMTMAETLSN